ncbi:MAG TPA: MucB/RseB C-terminal domain-containing protein [Gammaproteobacteria bacterium]
MMERRHRLLAPILLALLLPAAQAGTAGNTPETWLERMNGALRNLNYQGTFVYLRQDRMETLEITHRGDARGGIERIISLTGPKREIVRDHKEVKCIVPAERSVLVERRYGVASRLVAAIPAGMDAGKLGAYYKFRDLGYDRVAGIQCKVIGIEPRDPYRYGYKLWLDTRTAMLMRSDLLDQQKQLVERVVFTSLKYPKKIPDSALTATEIGKDYTWNIQGDTEQPLEEEKNLRWQADKLPPGFELSLSDVQRVAGAAHPVRHLVYSDGLATVSVFAELVTPGRKLLLGPSRVGAVNAFGRTLDDRHLTVVGEVPPVTVEMIAKAMQLQPR